MVNCIKIDVVILHVFIFCLLCSDIFTLSIYGYVCILASAKNRLFAKITVF